MFSPARSITTIFLILLSVLRMAGELSFVVVADATTRSPLPFASVFNRDGKAICISDRHGRFRQVDDKDYPLTIRYIGFDDEKVINVDTDTIFLHENSTNLPEVVVDSRKHKLLHVLAYVREYSTLTTYSDTITLFREKMVDYMLPLEARVKFKGWSVPRTLTSKSYYRFTDDNGLDSVSNLCNNHFSWSDWVGLAPTISLPHRLVYADIATDTLRGKYSPYEIWDKHFDKVTINVDVLADTASRKWVPGFGGFFRKAIDYDYFRITFRYDNIDGGKLSPADMIGCNYRVESNGRGRDMFRFNHPDEPFFVTTQADIYILDKEYVTEKDARKWADRKFDINDVGLFEPTDAPQLPPDVLAIIERVNNINHDLIRQEIEPDKRMIAKYDGRDNFKIGNRALMVLKQLSGISSIKFHKNRNNQWKEFRLKAKTMFGTPLPNDSIYGCNNENTVGKTDVAKEE